jgi:hypothetical protein
VLLGTFELAADMVVTPGTTGSDRGFTVGSPHASIKLEVRSNV